MMRHDELKNLFKSIQALCENPHWTSDRRWTIAELASKGIRLVESEADVPLSESPRKD